MRYLFILFHVCLFSSVLNSQTPDTIPPYIKCKNQVTATLSFICMATLSAGDVVDSVYDASLPIELGIRRICTGTGFPQKTQLQFFASDLGAQPVELWVKDAAGHSSHCQTNIQVTDFLGCESGFSMAFKTVFNDGIDSVYAQIFGFNCMADTTSFEVFSGTPDCCSGWLVGHYSQFGAIAPAPGYEVTVTPRKNDHPLNGVTSYDLTLISKHILGLEPLHSPYQIIAADANQDGKVTTFDIIVLRKLILGIINELPNGKSWRFMPKGYVFPNPQHPFMPPFPEKFVVPSSADPLIFDFDFIGVKIGDLNFSAFPGG